MGVGDIIGGVMNFGNSMAMTAGQTIADFMAMLNNEARYAEGKDILQGIVGRTPDVSDAYARYAQGSEQIAKYQGQKWNEMVGELVGNAKGVYDRNMAYLEGAGKQERKDINTQFNAASSGITQDLQSKGLGSSTILSSQKAAAERERADALGGLEERLRSQRINTDTALSGNFINLKNQLYQKRLASNIAGKYGTLANQFQSTTAPLDYNNAALQSLVGWIGNREDIYPSESSSLNLQSRMGAAGAPAYEAPDAEFDWLSPTLSGASSAASLLTAKAFFSCVDADATVQTPDGEKALKDVKIGDHVFSGDGEFKKVVRRDFGQPDRRRVNDYINVKTKNSSITLTRDHIIGGAAASKLYTGAPIIVDGHVDDVVSVESTSPVVSADLSLEGGGDYIVNGFQVSSMMDFYGVADNEVETADVD